MVTVLRKFNLRKTKKLVGIMLPGSKLYYKSIAIKTIWARHKNRHIDEQNKLENPEINTCLMVN